VGICPLCPAAFDAPVVYVICIKILSIRYFLHEI
jgi:hypothetical protein